MVGKRPGVQRLTQIGKLTERGAEALHRIFSGQKGVDVARAIGITRIHLSKVKNSEVGKAYMAELEAKRQAETDEVIRRLADLELNAVAVLEATLKMQIKEDGTIADLRDRVKVCPLNVQVRAAERHLERQGYSQPSRATVLHQHLSTGKVLADLKQRHADIEEKERRQLAQSAELPGELAEEASEETKGEGE